MTYSVCGGVGVCVCVCVSGGARARAYVSGSVFVHACVCARLCRHVPVRGACVRACARPCQWVYVRARVHVCVRACQGACLYTRVSARVCACVCRHVPVRGACVCACARRCQWAYVCARVNVCVRVCQRTCLYTRVQKCNENSMPQKREIAGSLREHHVMKDEVSYHRQSMHLGLNCVNSQGPGTIKKLGRDRSLGNANCHFVIRLEVISKAMKSIDIAINVY
jgi:hypothetical protein